MSEPQHIKRILPGVMANIARRMELYQAKHKAGVLAALQGYNGCKGYRRLVRPRQRNQGLAGRSGCVLGGNTDKGLFSHMGRQ
jgi:hypothetical protein